MTTPAAERLYLAQHLYEVEGRRNYIYNPNNKPLDELPVIFGFNNGGSRGWYEGVLLSEDGYCLGGHICSDEGYMPHDLGVLEGSREDRKKTFAEHYPDGYRMAFVSFVEYENCAPLQQAIEAYKSREKAENK